jgi:hypothetical protein
MIDEAHLRPDGVSDEVVEAIGKFSAALDHIEDARGHIYAFHRLMGSGERTLEEAYDLIKDVPGLEEYAEAMDREVLGRNPLPGMWSFQMVEGYDDEFYGPIKGLHQRMLDELLDGKRHVFEAEMKQLRRTPGVRGHEKNPAEALETQPE